jgi:hypothetical protein
MVSTQLEYRLELPKRLGVVGFGGIGEVVPSGDQLLKNKNFLPGGGGSEISPQQEIPRKSSG